MFENRVVNGQAQHLPDCIFSCRCWLSMGHHSCFSLCQIWRERFKQHLRNIEYSLVCFEVWICSHVFLLRLIYCSNSRELLLAVLVYPCICHLSTVNLKDLFSTSTLTQKRRNTYNTVSLDTMGQKTDYILLTSKLSSLCSYINECGNNYLILLSYQYL